MLTREDSETLALLVEAASDGALVLERGVIRSANAAARALLADDAIEGRPLRELVTELTDAPPTGVFTRRDGQSLALRALPISETTTGVLISSIEPPREGGPPRRAAAKEHEEFVYVVSHDLQAPARGIRSVVTWLRADHAAQLTGEAPELLNTLERKAVELSRRLDGLLAYSRAGRIRGALQEHAISDLLEEAAKDPAAPAREHITQRLDAPRLVCAREPMVLALRELLINARAHNETPVRVEVSAERLADRVIIRVRDDGRGLSRAARERALRIFFTEAASAGHVGVGLPIARRRVEAMGGRLELVEADGSSGLCVQLSLPALAPATEAATP